MHNTIIPLIALAASIANAQIASLPDLSGLPECAQKSAITGLGATGCKITDLTCICKAPAFIQAVGTQIAASCTPDDQKKAVAFANSICQPLGVTIPSEGLDTTASETAPSATEAKEVPSATEVATPEATETGVEPPYPVPGNGSNGTYGNSTALAFEGAGSRLDVAVQAGVVGLLVAAGFAVL